MLAGPEDRAIGLREAYLRLQRLLAAKGTSTASMAPSETVAIVSETLAGINLDPLARVDRVILWQRVSDFVITATLVADELARTLETMHGVERGTWQAEVDGHFDDFLATLRDVMDGP